MTDKQLDKLVRQKVRAAIRMQELREKLDPEIEARYGTHPGEVNCDPAIDALDYGLARNFTLADLDREMSEIGYPPNDQELSHAAGDSRQPETRSEN